MASGDRLHVFLAGANNPPASSYATFDTRNGHLVLDFDDSADESAIFKDVFSRAYAGGGITVNLHASYAAASGDVIWNAAIERIGDEQQDVDADGFAAVQSVTVTVPGTAGFVSIDAVTFTDGAQMDSLAAGELFRLKVTRDADNASDTHTGDAELHAVEILET